MERLGGRPGRGRDSGSQMLSQAVQLHGAGRLAEAEALYRAVLAAERNNGDALHRLGICLTQTGRFAEALKVLMQAAKVQPALGLVHLSLAEAQRSAGMGERALTAYGRAVRLMPQNALVHMGQGVALEALGRCEEALRSYQHVLALEPEHLDALAGCGNCLLLLGRAREARAAFEAVLARAPRHAGALNNLAVALIQDAQAEAALAHIDQRLLQEPGDAHAHANRGHALYLLDRLEEAHASYQRALEILPDYPHALLSHAATLMALRRYAEAEAALEHLLAVNPLLADAHYYRAMMHLVQGEYAKGWPVYDWRPEGRRGRPANGKSRLLPDADQSSWTSAMPGRSVLVGSEQGHGDTIQFVRYLAYLRAAGLQVTLEAQGPLVTLLARSDVADRVVAKGAARPAHDYYCPLLSLPQVFFARHPQIPVAAPLRADPLRVERWAQRLGHAEAPRIGLAWSGNAQNTNDRRRSIGLDRLAPLMALPAQFLSLQPEARALDRPALDRLPLRHEEGAIVDFDDTAALIELCDLVICVDTAVAHLAGSLGKPVWVLLPFAPDWRWLLARSDTPWYPSMRLFRQPQPGQWDPVIEALAAALARHLAADGAGS